MNQLHSESEQRFIHLTAGRFFISLEDIASSRCF
jgi:hypothetical protein